MNKYFGELFFDLQEWYNKDYALKFLGQVVTINKTKFYWLIHDMKMLEDEDGKGTRQI